MMQMSGNKQEVKKVLFLLIELRKSQDQDRIYRINFHLYPSYIWLLLNWLVNY